MSKAANTSLVTICIATFRRPTMLHALLWSICSLRVPVGFALKVVIVANEPGGSAESVATLVRHLCPHPIFVHVEVRQNIALARNRGVAEALRLGANYVLFVDDDEVVKPDWLCHLLTTQAFYAADVVTGPVEGRLPANTPQWLVKGRFFSSGKCADGTTQSVASTNNALVSAGLFCQQTHWFDERLGLTGGSDSLLFARFHRSGAKIVWAASAGVRETIPATRANTSWLLSRSFRHGQTATFRELLIETPNRKLWHRLAKGVGHLGYGALCLPLSLFGGRTWIVNALLRLTYGAGVFSALARRPYVEYSTVHGH